MALPIGRVAPRELRLRREAWGFAIGSVFFAIGSVPAYANAVGSVWGSATFFAGSLFFTTAGFIQLALSGRRPPAPGGSRGDLYDWWAAAVQFAGTLLFNLSTGAVLLDAVRAPVDPATGWRPDAWGSLCFLVASGFALAAAGRRHELWDPLARPKNGTWLNAIGSVAFGFSAVGAYVVPATGDLLDAQWVNTGTFIGAVCFFTAAILSRRNSAPRSAG